MRHKKLAFRLETKELKDTGEFTGYAAVFDNVDFYRDVIRRGAFTESIADWKKRGKLPPLLWQHDPYCPIGPHTDMYEDEKGLYIAAKLLIDDVPQARAAYALLKNKVIDGMSIGFDIAEGGSQYDGKTNIWNLTRLNLWENSLATFPANDEALVEEVKTILSAGKLPSPSEFEGFLRDVGFTRRAAKVLTSQGYAGLRDAGLSPRDAESDDIQPGATLGTALDELTNYLKG
jgi:HK97 family phage prohead protease